MNKIKRNSKIDIIKGIGIFGMVAGHSGCPITHFIYLFHMAIFFIASGYCYKESYSYNMKSVIYFIKRKILTLWFPYVLWTIIYSLLHNFFIRINIYTDNPLLLKYVNGGHINTIQHWSKLDIGKNILKAILLHGGTQMGGAFWFLATLMEISVLYCVIDLILNIVLNCCNSKKFVIQCIVSVILLNLGFMFYKIDNSIWGLDKVFSFYILFHLGYSLKKFGVLWSDGESKYLLHISILVITLAMLIVCNSFGSINLDRNSYVNPIYFLFVSFMGWQCLCQIAFFFEKNVKTKKIFICLGQNTLSVVIFHFLCFKIVSYIGILLKHQPVCLVAAFPVLYRGGVWWIAYTFIGLFIPVFMSIIWKKIYTKIFDIN